MPCSIPQSKAARSAPVWPPDMILLTNLSIFELAAVYLGVQPPQQSRGATYPRLVLGTPGSQVEACAASRAG